MTIAAYPGIQHTNGIWDGSAVDSAQALIAWIAQTRAVVVDLRFTGTDVLCTDNGRLGEYWVNSDTLLLLTQLQVLG